MQIGSAGAANRPRAATPAPAPEPIAALRHRLNTAASTPLLTGYDDATGERSELSTATAATWVAKLAHLLSDLGELSPGDAVAIDLPAHWLTAVLHLAAWAAGLRVDPTAPVRLVDAAAGPDAAPSPAPIAGTPLLAVSLAAPPSAPLPARPGVVDVITEAAGYPDSHPFPVPPPASLALRDSAGGHSHADLGRQARAADLPTGARVLSLFPRWAGAGELVAAVLAPLAAGGSAVLCRHPDPARLRHRVAEEHVTLVLPGPGPAGS